MTRRLIALIGAVTAILLVAMPASASAGTVSLTMHLTSNPPFAAPTPCGPFAGLDVISEDNGNEVMHITYNSNGFWATGTYEGDLQILPASSVTVDPKTGAVTSYVPDATRPTASGHVADWFGASLNLTLGVLHNAVNAQVVTSDGQSVSIHAIDHMQILPPYVPPFTVVRQFSNFTCS